MNSLPSFIASYLINSVWEVILIACAGWLACRLLSRLGPQAEHVGWVSTLFAALAAPAVPLLRWLSSFLPAFPAAAGNISITFTDSTSHAVFPKGLVVLPSGLVLILLLCYAGSLIYFSVRLGVSLVRTAVLLSRSCPVSLTPRQEELWRRCERSFSLNRVNFRIASDIAGPVTLGFRTPILLLPAAFVAESSDLDLLAAFAHECAHIQRRDFFKNLVFETASLVLAFHPVIWMIKARIAQTREILCDRMVTEKIVDPRTYAYSLLRLSERMALRSQARSAQAIGIFDADILEKRIMLINSKKRTVGPAARFGLIVPAALCILFTPLAVSAFAIDIQPASQSGQAQNSPYGPVYKVGPGVSAPTIVYAADAKYPASALRDKPIIDCIVVVGLIVDKTGVPKDVHIVKSFRKDFDDEAMKAVRHYEFKPAMKNKVPVAVAINVEVNFRAYK